MIKKTFCLVSISFLLVSCSSVDKKHVSVEEVMRNENVRTLDEVNQRFTQVLDSHPELSDGAKAKLKGTIFRGTQILQTLKNEENKIFQVLIDKSIRFPDLSSKELDNKGMLQAKLNDIYKRKAEVVSNLIFEVKSLSESHLINDLTERDMYLFMRDFRSLN